MYVMRRREYNYERKGSSRSDRARDRRRIVLMLLVGGAIVAILLYLCLTKSG